MRRVPPTGVISTFAGTGARGSTGDGGPATSALLNEPTGVAVAADGAVLIAQSLNTRLRRVSPVVDNTAPTATNDASTTAEDTPLTVPRAGCWATTPTPTPTR